jgi:hypothetical protein
MITDMKRVIVTMTQMERVIQALEDLQRTVLPQNPQLFATMAEAPLDDLNKLRTELHDYVTTHAESA